MFEGSIEEYIEGYFGVSYKPKKFKVNKHQLKWWEVNDEEGKKTNKCVLNFDLYECKVCVYQLDQEKKSEQASLDNPFETTDEVKKEPPVDRRHLELTIIGCETSFIFRTESNESLETIIEFLQHHITQSRGAKFNYPAPKVEQFWKHEQISEQQFIDEADTFDILLFQTNNSGSAMQRIGTWSEYDHIAIIVKQRFLPEEVWFFEATQDGVWYRNWGSKSFGTSSIKQLVGNFYYKVVLRKLKFERTEKLREKLNEFCAKVEGNPYMLSYWDQIGLVSKESVVGSFVEQGRGFFCSELVAKAYKYTGIMEPTEDSSSNFNPVHFSSDYQTIKLIEGANFSKEKLIVINNDYS